MDNTQKEVILLHPMKTGGRALINVLEKHDRHCEARIGHTQLDRVVELVGGIKEFRSYYSMMVCRNPYSRLHSFHRFCARLEKSHAHKYCLTSFDDFILNYRDILVEICPPQHNYFLHKDCYNPIDFIARFESYGEELTWGLQAIGIDEEIKTDSNRPWREFYRPLTQDIVYKAYKEDFDRLSYDYKI